jgi:peptidyl-prolyl cis-trans isomerase SurA
MNEGNAVITNENEFRYSTVTKLPPSPKPLEEVRGAVITLYQNQLEKEWVETLRSNNDISIDYKTLLGLIR